MRSIMKFRSFTLVAAALASLALGGCLDTTGTEGEDEPQIEAVTLTAATGSAATGTASVTRGAQAGTLTLRAGTMNALDVRVFGADGSDEPVVAERHAEFEIRLQLGDVPLISTLEAGYPYRFSVMPEGTGPQTYQVVVRHIGHGPEFEGYVNVVVEDAGGA